MSTQDEKLYHSPSTKKVVVELEDPCAVKASGENATLKKDNATIEVKEYTTVDNDVTFE